MQWEAVPAMGGGGGPVGARGLRTLAAGDAMLDFPTRNYHYRVEGHRGEEAARAVRSFSASIFSMPRVYLPLPRFSKVTHKFRNRILKHPGRRHRPYGHTI